MGTTATTTIATTSVVMNTTSHPVTYLGDDDWTCDTAPVKPLMPLCGDNGSGTIGGIPKEVVGDILVIVAQIIVSIQMVYEEKVLSQYAIAPLQAVGSEGTKHQDFSAWPKKYFLRFAGVMTGDRSRVLDMLVYII